MKLALAIARCTATAVGVLIIGFMVFDGIEGRLEVRLTQRSN